MAEESQPKTPSLQEQYSLVEKEEKSDNIEISEVKSTSEQETKSVTNDPTEEEKLPTGEEPTAVETSAEEEKLLEAAEETDSVAEQNTEDGEPEEEKPEIKIETAPADFRFPTTNQTRHCFTRYIEYHRCVAAKGEDASECDKFAKYYRSLCPSEWVERWNEQRENGTFPGPL